MHKKPVVCCVLYFLSVNGILIRWLLIENKYKVLQDLSSPSSPSHQKLAVFPLHFIVEEHLLGELPLCSLQVIKDRG